jgi:hypothetical protein
MRDGNVKMAVQSFPMFGAWKFVFIFTIVGFMLAYNGLETVIDGMDTDEDYDMRNEDKDISQGTINYPNNVKYILLWTPYFGDPSYHLNKVGNINYASIKVIF